jgi:hypothetical protein
MSGERETVAMLLARAGFDPSGDIDLTLRVALRELIEYRRERYGPDVVDLSVGRR